MYTKEDAALVRSKFWTTFGKYMKPIPNANGEDVNWINYKTGISRVRLKTDVQNGLAFILIEVSGEHEARNKIFDSLQRLNFHWNTETNILKDEYNDSEQLVHQITTTLDAVSVFRESDWPQIISFLKTNLIHFDKFWCEHKDFIELSL